MKDKAEELRQILNTIENFIIANEGIGSVSLKMLWDRLSDAITNLDQQSKWISVDERLPEVHGSVLIFKPSDFPDKVYVGWLSEGNRWFEEDGPDGVSFVDEVTHWMPLPDPPA